jgi:TolB-like protein/Flp pilus assembly protein TadD
MHVSQKSYCFEGFTLDLQRGCLRNGGTEIELRPKTFALLLLLVEKAGRLVSKDEVIRTIWPNVVAADESLTRCVSHLRQALGDSDQRLIKTIPCRGYIFDVPVRPARITPPDATKESGPPLSVVVLPFASFGDSENDHFADVLTNSLATDLAHLSGTVVIAPRTAFSYKGKALDTRQIGRELGVRYIVDGGVFYGSGRVRVAAQLVDAATGTLRWADRFDSRRTALLDMQDEITVRLARLVGIELVAAESWHAEHKGPSDVVSQDLSMRGRAVMNQPISAGTVRKARRLFADALRLDGGNIDALLGLAWTHMYEVSNWLSDFPAEQTQAAEGAIARALVLSPRDANVQFVRAEICRISQPQEVAFRGYQLALEFDSTHAAAHGSLGVIKNYLGRAQETEAHVSEAIRLSPQDPRVNVWHFYAGVAELFLGRAESATDRLFRALELNPGHELSHIYLAAALAEAGRLKEATMASETARRVAPNFSIAKYVSEARSQHPVYLAQRERVVAAMRMAGVPDELAPATVSRRKGPACESAR